MNIPTCHRCPERNRDDVRCQILEGKLRSVRGLGLTSIKFLCPTRAALFSPGQVVMFAIDVGDSWGNTKSVPVKGIVMRTKGRKVLVYSDGETDRQIVWLYPDRLTKTGDSVTVCIHCGRPEGREIRITTEVSEEHEWECRRELVKRPPDPEDPYGPSFDSILRPCEFLPRPDQGDGGAR